MKNRLGIIQRSANLDILCEFDVISLDIKSIFRVRTLRHENPSKKIGIQVRTMGDLDDLSRLKTIFFDFIHVAYSLNLSINEITSVLDVPSGVKFICGNIEFDSDTPIEIVEEQIKKSASLGYEEVILEVYSNFNNPIEKFISGEIYEDETGIDDLRDIVKKYPISLGFLNAKKEELVEINERLSLDN